ncbi:hypothetical protein [Microvirga calopogonii]|uniref:hypothetical protein n=1 Tax=Microvirga calopogonii TaxID=2078013 RepID=UPI001FE096CE|nr:hypothetical protein [Microvirga calopogonii]
MPRRNPGLRVRPVLKGSPVVTERLVPKDPSVLRALRARKGLPVCLVRAVRSALSVRLGHKDPLDHRDRSGIRKRKPPQEGSRVLRDQSVRKGRQDRRDRRGPRV